MYLLVHVLALSLTGFFFCVPDCEGSVDAAMAQGSDWVHNPNALGKLEEMDMRGYTDTDSKIFLSPPTDPLRIEPLLTKLGPRGSVDIDSHGVTSNDIKVMGTMI